MFWQLIAIWFIKLHVDFLTNIFLSVSLFIRIVVVLMFNVYFNLFIFCDVNADAALELRAISTKFFFIMFEFFFLNFSFFDWFFCMVFVILFIICDASVFLFFMTTRVFSALITRVAIGSDRKQFLSSDPTKNKNESDPIR